jgi:hypothetical protein
LRRRSGRDPPLIHAAIVPELPGSLGRIDGGILPPGGFIAYAVHQAMMDATEWDRELIACLATQGPRLQEPKMMRVGRFATTEEAELLGDIAKVRLVAIAAGSGNHWRAFVDASWLIITDIIWTRARPDRVIAGKRRWILRPSADGRPGAFGRGQSQFKSDLQQPSRRLR